MRAVEFIAEATFDNMQIIKKLADAIMDDLSSTLSYNDGNFPNKNRIGVSGRKIADKIMDEYSTDPEVYKKVYSRFKHAIQLFDQTSIIFVSDPEFSLTKQVMNSEGRLPAGVFIPYENSTRIAVFLMAFPLRHDPETDSIVMSNQHARNMIHSTLVHEIRHLFQYADNWNYMTSDAAFKHPYASRHIEIDAVWTQALLKYIDAPYTTAEWFTHEVMKELVRRKKLTPKQVDQYKKKTLRYFYDNAMSKPDEFSATRKQSADFIKREIESTTETFKDAVKLVPVTGSSTEYASAVLSKMIELDDTLEYLMPHSVQAFKTMAHNFYNKKVK